MVINSRMVKEHSLKYKIIHSKVKPSDLNVIYNKIK